MFNIENIIVVMFILNLLLCLYEYDFMYYN